MDVFRLEGNVVGDFTYFKNQVMSQDDDALNDIALQVLGRTAFDTDVQTNGRWTEMNI